MPHLKYHEVYRALEGRRYKETHYPGLLDKFPSIQKIESKSVYDPIENCRRGGVTYKFANLPELCQRLPKLLANQQSEKRGVFPKNNDNNKKYTHTVQELVGSETLTCDKPPQDPSLALLATLAKNKFYQHDKNVIDSNCLEKGVNCSDTVCQTDGKPLAKPQPSVQNGRFPSWLKRANFEKLMERKTRLLKPYCHFCEEYEQKTVKASYQDRINRINLCEECYGLLENEEKKQKNTQAYGECL